VYPLIRLPRSRGLQFDHSPPDPKPDELPVVLATLDHLIGSPSREYLSIDPMFAGQQIGGSPDVAIGDHSAFRSAASLTCPSRLGSPEGPEPGVSVRHQYREGRIGQHPLGKTAEDPFSQPTMSIAAHDQEPGSCCRSA
jgi:hypothetical protein